MDDKTYHNVIDQLAAVNYQGTVALQHYGEPLLDPKLESPTKIKTTAESKYLYILDPPTKRLAVLNKDGDLISQYTSSKFDQLKDFVVVEAEKKIYLLNGSSVFGIAASHLE